MRIEVIKMTLKKREDSGNNIIHQIERPLKIYGKFTHIKLFTFTFFYYKLCKDIKVFNHKF